MSFLYPSIVKVNKIGIIVKIIYDTNYRIIPSLTGSRIPNLVLLRHFGFSFLLCIKADKLLFIQPSYEVL